MDESYEPRRKRVNAARERQRRRKEREAMVTPRTQVDARARRTLQSALGNASIRRGRLLVEDAWWYVRHTPLVMMIAGVVVGAVCVLFAASHLVQGRTFPGVWAAGVYIGDMTEQEAQVALLRSFTTDVRIQMTDGDRNWTATTADLGLKLNPTPMIEAARSVGLAGVPFGWDVPPVVDVDYITAQNYLLDLSQKVQIPPYNAGYALQDGTVVGIEGKEGRMLDVGLTLEYLTQNIAPIVDQRHLDLIIQPLRPDTIDPKPYLEQVQQLISRPFHLDGYDPYTDQTVTWSTTPDAFVSWLEAGDTGLALRQDTFLPFVSAQTASLNPDGGQELRFLEPTETMDKMSAAIANQDSSVELRIRYRPVQYEVVSGDSAYSISRKTGIPYYLIEEANPGRDLNVLSVGDKVSLPSRDVAVPDDPVPNKRIIVDISTQSLVAFENDQPVFSWKVSTGLPSAPTAPGIYQILTHNDLAYGSSYTLCGTQGCGQWTMHWFMGVYEVQPGLMNGFHGAVELPNGTYLGGGNVGQPFTFGCVMSLDENAKALYDWADVGTLVEIISDEFPPQSDLAKLAFPA